MKDTPKSRKTEFSSKGILYSFDHPLVMGILNITPDSFYSQSRVQATQNALECANRMVEEGADILDIGGYSSRPGATEVSEEEEIRRVLEVIPSIRQQYSQILISIDTFRSKVAKAAVLAGASMINDISAGRTDVNMHKTAAELQVPYIAMHIRGNPATMQSLAVYKNVVTEVYQELDEQIQKAKKAGVKDIIVDPGFGFAKTAQQNFILLKNLERFEELNCPILVGISRKSMIYKTLEIEVEDALNGTSVLNTVALMKGATILRVHDVKEAKQAVMLVSNML